MPGGARNRGDQREPRAATPRARPPGAPGRARYGHRYAASRAVYRAHKQNIA